MASSIADDYMDQTMDVIEDDSFQCKACGEVSCAVSSLFDPELEG